MLAGQISIAGESEQFLETPFFATDAPVLFSLVIWTFWTQHYPLTISPINIGSVVPIGNQIQEPRNQPLEFILHHPSSSHLLVYTQFHRPNWGMLTNYM
jgi:hypothetical protein